MKKLIVMGAAVIVALGMTSCHSSESAYKKAYEKAQAAQNNEETYAQQYATTVAQQTTPTQVTAVTPVTTTTTPVATTPVATTTVTTPVTTTTTTAPVRVTPTTDYSNVAVRTEAVTLVNGAGLKAYSVVVGAFGMMSNAQALQSTLAQKGYAAQIVQATVNGSPFYRVVATTYDTKNEAAQSRASLMAEYPGAWLLYQK